MREKNPETAMRIRRYIDRYCLETGVAPSIRTISDATGIPRPTVQRYLVALGAAGEISYENGRIATGATEKFAEEQTTVALLGEVACGLPGYAEEHIEAYLRLPRALVGHGNCYLLRARGESMIEAGILSGDIIIVHRTPAAQNGEIVVALVEDEATVKRFYKENGHYRLQPENSTMEPIIVDSVLILGKVVALLREY